MTLKEDLAKSTAEGLRLANNTKWGKAINAACFVVGLLGLLSGIRQGDSTLMGLGGSAAVGGAFGLGVYIWQEERRKQREQREAQEAHADPGVSR